MMNYARLTTLRAVSDLSVAQLDYQPAGFGNTIGALLEHVAAVEACYQEVTFYGQNPDTDEAFMRRWGAGLDLGERIGEIRGRPLEHYVLQLEEVRAKTLEEFAKRDDAWLNEEFPWWDGETSNNYFCWFHVFEDEVNHRGQIRLIRKNLTSG